MAPVWGAGSWGHTRDNWVAASTSGEDEVHRAQESHGGGGGPFGSGRDEKQAGQPQCPTLRLLRTSSSLCWVAVAVGGAGWGGAGAGAGLAEELQEAALTVGLVVLLLEGALVELLEAKGAHEVLGVELLGHGGDAAASDGLLAAGAQRAATLVVVHLTIWLPVVLEEAAIDEGREALPAHKAFGVPESVEGRDVVLQDGTGTAATLGREHVEVILPTVGFAVFLVEPFWTKEGSTLGTEEVFWVPCAVQCCHHFIQDGPVAVVAAWGEEAVVVLFTVGLSVPLEEVPGANLFLAVGAHKVLGVPCLPHGSHHLPSNGLLAGSADPFGNSGDPQLVQVGLQTPQHAVKLAPRF